MKLRIKEECSADIKKILSENESLVENIERDLRYSSKNFSIEVELLSNKEKEDLLEYFKSKKDRTLVLQLQNYIDLKKNQTKLRLKIF